MIEKWPTSLVTGVVHLLAQGLTDLEQCCAVGEAPLAATKNIASFPSEGEEPG
jgi:hypothetical protein